MNDYELIDVFQSQQTLVDVERECVSELLLFVMIETHTHREKGFISGNDEE